MDKCDISSPQVAYTVFGDKTRNREINGVIALIVFKFFGVQDVVWLDRFWRFVLVAILIMRFGDW